MSQSISRRLLGLGAQLRKETSYWQGVAKATSELVQEQ